jgi:hypothetical protein
MRRPNVWMYVIWMVRMNAVFIFKDNKRIKDKKNVYKFITTLCTVPGCVRTVHIRSLLISLCVAKVVFSSATAKFSRHGKHFWAEWQTRGHPNQWVPRYQDNFAMDMQASFIPPPAHLVLLFWQKRPCLLWSGLYWYEKGLM